MSGKALIQPPMPDGSAFRLAQVVGRGATVDAFDLDRGPVFSQTSLAIDAAIAGQGIALARSALASLDLGAGRLIRPVPEEVPAEFAYWIVCPKPNASRPNIRRFRQWLLSQPHLYSE